MMEAIQAEEMAFQLTTSRRGRLDPEAVVISGRDFQLTTSRRGRPDQKI